MEESKLNAKEIFEQIKALQKHLTEGTEGSLGRLTDALALLDGDECEDGEASESRTAQVEQVCDVFKTRELSVLRLLELYEKMYNNLQDK